MKVIILSIFILVCKSSYGNDSVKFWIPKKFIDHLLYENVNHNFDSSLSYPVTPIIYIKTVNKSVYLNLYDTEGSRKATLRPTRDKNIYNIENFRNMIELLRNPQYRSDTSKKVMIYFENDLTIKIIFSNRNNNDTQSFIQEFSGYKFEHFEKTVRRFKIHGFYTLTDTIHNQSIDEEIIELKLNGSVTNSKKWNRHNSTKIKYYIDEEKRPNPVGDYFLLHFYDRYNVEQSFLVISKQPNTFIWNLYTYTMTENIPIMKKYFATMEKSIQ